MDGRISNDTTQSIIRIIVTLILCINAILTAIGKNPIDLDETSVTAWIEYGAGFVAWCWSVWKNFNITAAAKKAQKVLEDEKRK